MTNLQKNEIIQLIQDEKERMGSYAKVATKCEVSTATISQMINLNHDLIKAEMWIKVGSALGKTNTEWQIAETLGYKKVTNICNDAKNEGLFMIISDQAGIGKTSSLKTYQSIHADDAVIYLQCREWAKREFLTELCKCLGIDPGKYYIHIDKLGMKVVEYFQQRADKKPLLIIDEADKLRDSALRWFIHLYNEMEDKMGCIISGTENLSKRIKDGVRLRRLGFDEIESRFGRTYLHLIGATMNDTRLICSANGIIDKEMHTKIFTECGPVKKVLKSQDGSQEIKVVEDLRRMKRVIKRERLKEKYI